MNEIETKYQFKTMHLSGMAKEFELQINDTATYSSLGFEDRFGLIVDAEWNVRQVNKLKKCIRNARLDIPSATMEGIEYHEDRKLDKAELLRYASCVFINEGHHIILKGATGSGKTYIACALGNAACRKFKNVRYVRLPELLDELTIARAENQFKKVVTAYSKFDLLIIDEWLIRCLSPQDSYHVLEIIEKRTKHGATIFCTQYEPSGWYSRINADLDQDSPIAEAIIDRIINNSYIVSVEGRISMRERHGIITKKGNESV